MLYSSILLIFIVFSVSANSINKHQYISMLEKHNHISYSKIVNSRGIYTVPMCYAKTKDKFTHTVSNSCYICHTKGSRPNYNNDAALQQKYSFPIQMIKNPFLNIFKDHKKEIKKIDDKMILKYVRDSNYFDKNGSITLSNVLPNKWKGYVPDCYFNFDADGFDKTLKGKYTLWRAYRYYPVAGMFWPTNGSSDDVMIRLSKVFSKDYGNVFDIDVYKLNLAIVEAVVKQKDISLENPVNEKKYGVDINQNGILDIAKSVKLNSYEKMSYVGQAKSLLNKKMIHLALGLFPEGTEFLHSVRYLDWNDKEKHVTMAAHMKELRYAKKKSWKSYSDLEREARKELYENNTVSIFRGNYEEGLRNEMGWVYQGFIEDRDGLLRPQTHEETISCMGCHSHLGSTTDSIFSFTRKFEGTEKKSENYGWNHWSQKGLIGVKEAKVYYENLGTKFEYSFYLKNNLSSSAFRNNTEADKKFFTQKKQLKRSMIQKLHNDISLLLLPSKERALKLNKAYKVLVTEQSYIYRRYANIETIQNVFDNFNTSTTTGIIKPIIRR